MFEEGMYRLKQIDDFSVLRVIFDPRASERANN